MEGLKRFLILALITLNLSSFFGCSSFSGRSGTLKFKDEVSLQGQGEVKTIKAGEEVQITDEPLLVEKPGYLPMLIIPISQQSQAVEVAPKKLGLQYLEKNMAQENINFLNNILEEVTQIQLLMGHGKLSEASQKMDVILGLNPKLDFLLLLKASLNLMQGQTQVAESLVEQVLARNPQSQLARDFSKYFQGEKSPLPRNPSSRENQ